MPAIGVDVGGSSIKAGLVDTATGQVVGETTVHPLSPSEWSEPSVLLDTIASVAGALGDTPIGVGFPAVVDRGVLLTGPTSHQYEGWVGMDLTSELGARLGRDVDAANDADVAAVAEYHVGAARDVPGTALVLTLGTGIGSGLLRDGHLVPNVELGRLYLQGHHEVVEEHASARVRTEQQLSWAAYAERLGEALAHIERLLAPDVIVVAGGITVDAEQFLPLIRTRARLVTARLRDRAGIVGAALLTDAGVAG